MAVLHTADVVAPVYIHAPLDGVAVYVAYIAAAHPHQPDALIGVHQLAVYDALVVTQVAGDAGRIGNGRHGLLSPIGIGDNKALDAAVGTLHGDEGVAVRLVLAGVDPESRAVVHSVLLGGMVVAAYGRSLEGTREAHSRSYLQGTPKGIIACGHENAAAACVKSGVKGFLKSPCAVRGSVCHGAEVRYDESRRSGKYSRYAQENERQKR